MDLRLSNKKAFISGGTQIGLEIAKYLGQEGCEVIICSRTQERLDTASNILNEMNIKTLGLKCDVNIRQDIENCIDHINDKVGNIDILINNVGGGTWGNEDILSTDQNVWDEVYDKMSQQLLNSQMVFYQEC